METISRSNKRALLWPIAIIFGLGLAAGAAAVSLRVHVALALLQLIQPGDTALLYAEEPAIVFLFPLRLFGLSFLTVAVCGATSLTVAWTRSKAVAFLLLF